MNTVELVRNILPRIIVYNVNTVEMFPPLKKKNNIKRIIIYNMNTVIRSKALRPPNVRQKILLTKNRGGTGSTLMHYQNQCSKNLPTTGLWFPVEAMPNLKVKKG